MRILKSKSFENRCKTSSCLSGSIGIIYLDCLVGLLMVILEITLEQQEKYGQLELEHQEKNKQLRQKQEEWTNKRYQIASLSKIEIYKKRI